MLERTSSCLEPASQLFLRRFDSPIRSARALGPGFWRNGADQLHVSLPPWWPFDPSKLSSPPSLSLPDTDCHSALLCRSSLRTPNTSTKLSRFYTQHVALRQAVQGEEAELPNLPPVHNASQALDADLEYYSHPQNPPTDPDLLRIRSLFIQVFNQADYAARVLRLLSRASSRQLLTAALNAYVLIPFDQRSQKDYLCAVQAAIKSNKHQYARQVNAEATARTLNRDCSPLLLLYSLSNQLWMLAVQVWQESFHTDPTHGKLLAEISTQPDLQQKLPSAIIELGKILKSPTPTTSGINGLLRSLSFDLQRLIFSSGPLMSDITPKGLLEILQTSAPSTKSHEIAIKTLLKSATRVDKGPVAMLIYHHLRSLHPSFTPSPALMGSLISIHCQEEAPGEPLTYLLQEFATHHGAADQQAYHAVLHSLSKRGDVHGTQSVFLELSRIHGQPKHPKFYAPLIYAYARVADAEGAQSVFDHMENLGVERSTHCWNILLYAYVRAFQPERALQLFQSMITQRVVPDAHTFGTLMSIPSSSGDINEVTKMIQLAQQYDIKVSYEMTAGVVHSHCLNDNIDDAIQFAVSSTRAMLGGSPVKMWNHILRYYAFRAEPQNVLRVQNQMKELGVVPDAMTYASYMTALIVVGKTGEAARILRHLDIKKKLMATRFHYAIVLQGFLLEGNRDMGQVIYNEMLQRFPDVGPSARLAMLRLKGQMSLEAGGLSVEAVSDDVAETLAEISVADRATNEPQRGIVRRRNVDAFPSAFLEDLSKLLVIKGRFKQAGQLLNRFSSLAESTFLGLNRCSHNSITLLTTRLAILKRARAWDLLEDTWMQILKLGVKLGQSIDASPLSGRTSPNLATELPATTNSQLTVDPTIIHPEPQTMQISSFAEPWLAHNSPPNIWESKILFPRRFILSAAITRYLSAMAERKLFDKAIQTVERLQTMGFALTSKNLNFYIQSLIYSPNLEHTILAFQLFEEKLLPNTPPWSVLIRGKWKATDASERHTVISTYGLEKRKDIEKRRPDLLLPTYLTCVHLAMVLQQSQRLAKRGEGDTLPLFSLSQAAPGTFHFIRKIPHVPDRIQGILLRNTKTLRGDSLRHLGHQFKADRSGVLESQSPVDHVPVDKIMSLEEDLGVFSSELNIDINARSFGDFIGSDEVPSPRGTDRDLPVVAQNESIEDSATWSEPSGGPPMENSVITASAQNVARGELYEGQINRSYIYLDHKHRFESSVERSARIKNEERKLMDVIQTMRSDVKHPRLMSHMRFGRPSFKAPARKAPSMGDPPITGRSLYNPTNHLLENIALAAKSMRDDQMKAINFQAGYGRTGKSKLIPKFNIGPSRLSEWIKVPAGPYTKRSLYRTDDARSPLDVKLAAKVDKVDSLPRSLLRGFTINRMMRQRQASLQKWKEEAKRRTWERRAQREEAVFLGDQSQVYKTLDETVEMNRAKAAAARVNEKEWLHAQRLEAHKAESRRILKAYAPERERKQTEAEILSREDTDDDENKKR